MAVFGSIQNLIFICLWYLMSHTYQIIFTHALTFYFSFSNLRVVEYSMWCFDDIYDTCLYEHPKYLRVRVYVCDLVVRFACICETSDKLLCDIFTCV